LKFESEKEDKVLINEVNRAYKDMSSDQRVSVWHISLYMALLHRWCENDYANPVQITRREIMKLAHIGSVATYHKFINQLQEFEYIKYSPSYNPSLGSQVFLCKI
jgi:hypothetical protein